MKKICLLLVPLFFLSCSSIQVVDSWKNEDVLFFKPQKLLVVGITDNLTARMIFEEQLKNEFFKRNINAVVSTKVLDESFTNSERSEEEIQQMIEGLSEKGFDAVIISAVKGVDEKNTYYPGYYTVNYHWTRFGKYYYRYQDIYYNPAYYNAYSIYRVETSIYNINEQSDKALVWVGALNIVDPQSIKNTVNEYVATIMKRLEKERIITPI